jgi:hypothetical protein
MVEIKKDEIEKGISYHTRRGKQLLIKITDDKM